MNALPRFGRYSFALLAGVFCWAVSTTTLLPAQEKQDPAAEPQKPPFKFQAGPLKALLGTEAEIAVPAKYEYLDAPETIKYMNALGNITNGKELGYIAPADADWFVVFEFSDVGYVKDDEKDSLDADAILESMKLGTEQANETRKQRGIPPLHVTGWKYPPSYDPSTNNLQWCIAAESEGQPVLNYNTRILGRNGVMEATLVCGPEDLDAVVAKYKSLIAGFTYVPGHKYGEFRSGDRVAEYGLTALVAGGGKRTA